MSKYLNKGAKTTKQHARGYSHYFVVKSEALVKPIEFIYQKNCKNFIVNGENPKMSKQTKKSFSLPH